MKESFLQFIWQHQLFNTDVFITKNYAIEVVNKGTLNSLQGPDFFNAILIIDHQKWAGNVEIHLKSSDWFAHGHHLDENYKNVILHVVYEHDVDIYNTSDEPIPVLELKHYIDDKVMYKYDKLMKKTPEKWIYCEDEAKQLDSFLMNTWLERLYIQRLERKVNDFKELYLQVGKDWELTLFLGISKYFLGNLNGDIILDTLLRIPTPVLKKAIVNHQLEPLLFGTLGMLSEDYEETYVRDLQKEYVYIKQKFDLEHENLVPLNFFGCRPFNFPTVRIAQLVTLYHQQKTLFSKVLESYKDIDTLKELFKIKINDYWQKHYNFDKVSRKSYKKISDSFLNLLFVNVIAPVLFFYLKEKGEDIDEIIELIHKLPAEKNSTVDNFKKIKFPLDSALHSQALLTLKKNYCDVDLCAKCMIGGKMLLEDSFTMIGHKTFSK